MSRLPFFIVKFLHNIDNLQIDHEILQIQTGAAVGFTTPLFILSNSVGDNYRYHMGTESFFTQFYGFALQKGWRYKPIFDNV